MTNTAATVWRDFVTDGVPASGSWKPQKSDVRAWGASIEATDNAITRCRVVATSNVVIATGLAAGNTIDGVTLVANDLVLLTAQAAPAENGVYLAPASGAASRSASFNVYDNIAGTMFAVMDGTLHHDSVWQCTSSLGGSIGVTAIAISQLWPLNDTSAVAGNAAKMWNPSYFGNPASGVVHRLNRLLVGEATVNSSDLPATTKSWIETLISNTVATAQFASTSATGNLGVVGAARTSDYRAWAGAASGGSQGVTGFGWNDDTTPATTPIAVGGEFRGFRKATVNGITAGAQISAANEGSTVDVTPFGGVVSGSTFALLLTNGPGPTGYVNPISAHLALGSGTGAEVARKGIVSLNGALDTSIGAGGGGVSFEAFRGQSFRWLNSSDTVDSEIWGNASGLNVAGAANFINTSALANFRVADTAGALTGNLAVTASAAATPFMQAEGSASNVDFGFRTKGTGSFTLSTNGTAKQLEVTHTASAVNYWRMTGSAASNASGPTLAALGSDADIPITIQSKGAGSQFFNVRSLIALQLDGVASAVNRMAIINAATTGQPMLYVAGSDANISGRLRGSGTGGWQFLDGATNKKFEYNTTGIGFFGVTPAAQVALALPTGTAQATTYATSTVTLAQLAGYVMQMATGLKSFGLFS